MDYVQTLLVAEPIKVLQESTDALVPLLEIAKFTEYLIAVCSFLKYCYYHHAIMQSCVMMTALLMTCSTY